MNALRIICEIWDVLYGLVMALFLPVSYFVLFAFMDAPIPMSVILIRNLVFLVGLIGFLIHYLLFKQGKNNGYRLKGAYWEMIVNIIPGIYGILLMISIDTYIPIILMGILVLPIVTSFFSFWNLSSVSKLRKF
ncbi:hypothetical protein DY120_05255 [Apilactobacillus micheneri]|uniref:Integral membrane protein n=2 Tax=Apilactobacillus micheneri TaxID=1899430 RepID=A0ABY2YWS2_9LACO|nr:hypothetical protein DY114_05255 [Apilactobacillus micheneri]TPR25998.1 hypothetical protein DY111_05255 [Apilactobacillus micheneri]TPR28188.1 hypothetical protein DY113_03200 [Apilactobacillus micheneri]TPR29679.1 hypothetical protein DY117_05255 [Apilactobacillus micheneri]TPR30465.1 hypothetical protein DY120_05255 [Apilactobacillus micheneri]